MNQVERRCTLFLDIDGVLLPTTCVGSQISANVAIKALELFPGQTRLSHIQWRQAASYSFDPTALAHLNTMIQEISSIALPRIVLSSSWRMVGSLEDLKRQVFDRTGFAHLLFAKTNDNNAPHSELNRGAQIHDWLHDNHAFKDPFIILDDCDFPDFEQFRHRFIKIDPSNLLTNENIAHAMQIAKMDLEKKDSSPNRYDPGKLSDSALPPCILL